VAGIGRHPGRLRPEARAGAIVASWRAKFFRWLRSPLPPRLRSVMPGLLTPPSHTFNAGRASREVTGEEGSCGDSAMPASVRASALFTSTGGALAARPPSAPPSAARAFEASVLKAITSGLFDDEAAGTDEDSVAGLPALPPVKGGRASVLRRRSIDEVSSSCNNGAGGAKLCMTAAV
jgi:hypothetical protein